MKGLPFNPILSCRKKTDSFEVAFCRIIMLKNTGAKKMSAQKEKKISNALFVYCWPIESRLWLFTSSVTLVSGMIK